MKETKGGRRGMACQMRPKISMCKLDVVCEEDEPNINPFPIFTNDNRSAIPYD